MTVELYTMLKTSAEADKAKALLSLELLGNKAVGIGDHSTEDYFKNAFEALDQLSKAEEQIEILDRYFPDDNPSKMLND